MGSLKVTVIDYGIGNLLSVQRGFEYCGAVVRLTSDPDEVLDAERLVLPGVGAFANGMQALVERDLVMAIQTQVHKGTPLLGICLGMQMLLDESEEFGITRGLGLISGRVVHLPTHTISGKIQKIPHIGWGSIIPSEYRHDWKNTILEDSVPGEATYFVHSFISQTTDPMHRLADCFYGGYRVPAVIAKGHIMGCQFHPEKSGEVGLRILRRFCAS
jgi:glutamine amidotransferase